MANASCSTCTLVSNVLTLAGSVSGTVLVGMTITGAGVPAGVTITSNGTGSGGVGTYNCSASAANVIAAEAMVFSLSWDMPLQGNASTPQFVDMAFAAGAALIIHAAFGGGTASMGRETQFGTHANAIYDSQAISGSKVFRSVAGKQGPSPCTFVQTFPQTPETPPSQVLHALTKTSEVGTAVLPLITAAPQAYDFTQQAVIVAPNPPQGGGFSAEYQFGLHQKTIYDSQATSAIFAPSLQTAAVSSIVRQFVTPPQNVDLTIQGFVNTVPVAQGWIVTMVTAGPQLADLTVQANLAPTRPFLGIQAPWNPRTIVSVSQDDPTQIPARVIKPPAQVAPPQKPTFVNGAPDRADYTQPQGQVLYTSLPGPSRRLQPAFVWAFEQQYDKNLYPIVFTPAAQLGGTPPAPLFRVMAVTAGWYAGVFRTPGDVFDLLSNADFSDSTIDYMNVGSPFGSFTFGSSPFGSGNTSNTVAFGWMKQVPRNTALFDWLSSNGAPYLPPQDPFRRFIL